MTRRSRLLLLLQSFPWAIDSIGTHQQSFFDDGYTLGIMTGVIGFSNPAMLTDALLKLTMTQTNTEKSQR